MGLLGCLSLLGLLGSLGLLSLLSLLSSLGLLRMEINLELLMLNFRFNREGRSCVHPETD